MKKNKPSSSSSSSSSTSHKIGSTFIYPSDDDNDNNNRIIDDSDDDNNNEIDSTNIDHLSDIEHKKEDDDDDDDDDTSSSDFDDYDLKDKDDEDDQDEDDEENSFMKNSASLNKSLQLLRNMKQQQKKNKKKNKKHDSALDTTTAISSGSTLMSSSSPLNTSVSTTSALIAKDINKTKILYTLWFVDPEWIDEIPPSDDEDEDGQDRESRLYYDDDDWLFNVRRMKYTKYMMKSIKTLIKLPWTIVQFISTKSTRQSKISQLHLHHLRQPKVRLLSSDDGTLLANTQNSTIVIRSLNDNFNSIQKKWNVMQYDKEAQWQRLCFSPDNLIMAFSTSGCTIYIICIETEATIHILSPHVLGINPRDGIVDLAIRIGICTISNTPIKCYELLVMGYDMILRRFHVPFITPNNSYVNNSNSFTIHPIVNSTDPSSSNGCFPQLSPVDVKNVHYSVGCIHYCHEKDILAVGGNRRSKRPNRKSVVKPFVSFWKLMDKAPYFKLLNQPGQSGGGGDLDTSVDNLNTKLQQQQQQQQQKNNKQKNFFTKLTTSIFGDYSQSIIHKIRFSPDSSQLIALDLNGSISLWNTPSLSSSSSSTNNNNIKPIKVWNTNDLIHVWDKVSPINSPINSNNNNNNNNNHNGNNSSLIQQNEIFSKQVIDVSWWSNQEIILANEGGEFVIFSMETGENCLLHDPEIVASVQPPILTSAHKGRFFILETSGDIVFKPSLLAIANEQFKERVARPTIEAYKYVYRYFYGDHPTDYDEFNFQIDRDQYGRNIFDRDRRREARGSRSRHEATDPDKQNIIRKIIRFQSTTPEQLFKAKVAQKEYSNAIIIAEHYGLDKDLVHQKRWSKSIVSQESIKSFLSKVQDLQWILWECHTRIPINYEGAKLLLEYGIQRSYLSEPERSDNSIIILHRNILINYLNRLTVYKEIYGNHYDALDYLRFRSCKLESVAIEYATVEHFKAIQVLFTYYPKTVLPERLNVLSMIPETTDPTTYSKLLPDATNFWAPKKPFELDWCQKPEVFTGKIANIYEQRANSTYLKSVLQSLGSDYEDIRGRDKVNDIYSLDFVLNSPANHTYTTNYSFATSPKLESQPSSSATSPTIHRIDSGMVTKWYQERAIEIDKRSGQVDNSLSLLNIALEKEVMGLNEMHSLVEQVNTIVYETGQEISLEKYIALDTKERINLLLGDSTPSTIYQNIVKRCLVYYQENRLYKGEESLIINYFEDLAKKGTLKICKSYIEEAITRHMGERECPTLSTILTIALSAMYACTSTTVESISQMDIMVSLIPERSYNDDDSVLHTLYDRLSKFKSYIQSNMILSKYDMAKTIEYHSLHHDADDCQSLLSALCKYGKQQRFKNAQWKTLFEDFITIRQHMFHNSDQATLYSFFVKNLLAEGRYTLAKEYFTKCGSPERVEQLVLVAARELFNASQSLSQVSEEAQLCLDLIKPPTRKIIRELNLIKASDILYSKFNYTKIPIQVRLILEKSLIPAASGTSNIETDPHLIDQPIQSIIDASSSHPTLNYMNYGRFELIQSLLDTNPTAYKSIEEILSISNLLKDWRGEDEELDIGAPSDKIIIQVMLIKKALSNEDYPIARAICLTLIENEKSIPPTYKEVWNIFATLALNVNYGTMDERLELLSYALMYCNESELANLLEAYQEMDIRKDLLKDCEDHGDNTTETLESLKLSRELNNPSNVGSSLLLEKYKSGERYLCQQYLNKEKDMIKMEPPFIESEQYTLVVQSMEQDEDDEQNQLYKTQLLLHIQQIIKYINTDNMNNNNNSPQQKGSQSPQLQHLQQQQQQQLQEEETIVYLTKLSICKGQFNLALSYLFSLSNTDIPDEIFNQLIKTSQSYPQYETSLERIIILACYYYSIRLLSSTTLTIHMVKDDNNILFNQTIDSILKEAKKLIDYHPNECSSVLKDKVNYYHSILIDSIQAKELSDMKSVIDFERFREDENYKKETIIQFAQSNELKSFQTSLSMAERYGISNSQVVFAYIEWKILHDNSVGPLFLDSQMAKSSLSSEAIHNLYNEITGVSYQKLQRFYDILQKLDMINTLSSDHTGLGENIQARLKLLSQLLKSAANKHMSHLNFKKMVDQKDYDVYLEELQKVLSEENIAFCCNIISILQTIRPIEDNIQNHTISSMYHDLIDNIIQKNINQQGSSGDGWDDGSGHIIMETCTKYRKQLDDHDIQELYDCVSVGDYSKHLTLAERIHTVDDLLQWKHVKNNTSLVEHYKEILNHLEVFSKLQQQQQSTINLEKTTVDEYHQNFIQQRKNNDFNYQEFKQSQCDLILPMVIPSARQPQDVLDLYRLIKTENLGDQDLPIISNYYKQYLSTLLQQQQEGENEEALKKELERFVNQFKKDKEWLSLLPSIAQDILRTFIYNSNKPQSIRILLLDFILNQTNGIFYHLESDQDKQIQDRTLLNQFKTKQIIKNTWVDVDLKDIDIDSPESSVLVFDTLIKNCDTMHKVVYLSELLSMWSSQKEGNIIATHDCWCRLYLEFIKLIHGSNGLKSISQLLSLRIDQCKQFPITLQEENQVLEELSKKVDQVTGFKFGLLSNYKSIQLKSIQSILDYIKSIDNPSTTPSHCTHNNNNNESSTFKQFIDSNQQLLQLIFQQGYIYKFADTRLYDPLQSLLKIHNSFDQIEEFEDQEQYYQGKRNSIHQTVEHTISQLVIHQNYYHAASLCIWWLGITPIYCTFDISITYLYKYLLSSIDKLQRHIDNRKEKETEISQDNDDSNFDNLTWNNILENFVKAKEIFLKDLNGNEDHGDEDDEENDE